MAKTDFVGGSRIVVEDVGGSFVRFLKEAPRVGRALIAEAVKTTAFTLSRRMEALAPYGPDAPHIKETIEISAKGMRADVGYIGATAAEPASPGSSASIADVALYNEYRPDEQPFMRPAAEAEQADFTKRVERAILMMERSLSSGVGI